MILRLLTQVVAAGVAIYISGGIMDERVFRDEIVQIPKAVFMIGFIVRTMLCINAINWFDGVYGLAS
jgi:UDP-N-acetylmuramyl pentapeptide phosphotransferase/UDP-N-acetylglucosamine-1-phosphate transferase